MFVPVCHDQSLFHVLPGKSAMSSLLQKESVIYLQHQEPSRHFHPSQQKHVGVFCAIYEGMRGYE